MTKKDENLLIDKIKEYTKQEFLFNKQLVYYNKPQNQFLEDLPDNIPHIEDEIDYDKTHFKTPYSHMLHVLINIGRAVEQNEIKKFMNMEKKNEK